MSKKPFTLSRFIKQRRIELQLSQRDVEDRSGISNAYISQLETGKRTAPYPDVLRKLAAALEVPYLTLMELAGYMDEPITTSEWAAPQPSTLTPNEETEEMSNFILTDTQEMTVTAQPVDRAGNPAAIDGPITWSSSDDSVITVTPMNEAGTEAKISATGKLGGGIQIVATADAALGAEVELLTGTLVCDVIAGRASSLQIGTSEPTEKPEA